MVVTDEMRITATRSSTIQGIKAMGLDKMFPLSKPFLADLHTHFTSLEGLNKASRQAQSMVSVVSKFLHHQDNARLNPIHLTNKKAVTKYIQFFKDNTTSSFSTLMNALRAIAAAVNFIKKKKMAYKHSPKQVLKCIRKLIVVLNKGHARRKSYVRNYVLQEQAGKPDLSTAPKKLLAYGEVVTKKFLSDTVNAECLTKPDKNELTSYMMAALAILNASRSSHVTNLSLGEYRQGRVIGDDYITLCCFAKSGLAPVTFTRDLRRMTDKYIEKVRPLLTSDTSDSSLLFVNCAGKRITNLSSDHHLYKVMKLAGIDNKFNLTQLRKAVSTQAARDFDATALTLVNSYLAHSQAVALEFYIAANSHADFHRGFGILQEMYGVRS